MKKIRTKIDEICFYLEDADKKTAKITDLAELLDLDKEEVLDIVDMLSRSEVCEIDNSLDGKKVKLKIEFPNPKDKIKYGGTVLQEYTINANGVKAYVEILKDTSQPVDIYFLSIPTPSPYTDLYLKIIKDYIAKRLTISVKELSDPRKNKLIINRFYTIAKDYLDKIPKLSSKNKKILGGLLLNKMYGLGDLEFLLSDNNLEDIGVNGSNKPISVYHKKHGWLKSNLAFLTEDEIYNLSAQIGRKSNRDITLLSPILDTHLVSGDRASATLFPISTSGNTLTIRKFARDPWTITDFIHPDMNTLSLDMAAFLWLSVQYEMNILIGGGTASGKTSLLNTLAALTPSKERIVSIEDTREINLPNYLSWNWVPLTTRESNIEDKGGVSMLELIHSSLRMRPDRIMIGEIREKNEAEVAFEAMHTGHAVYSTIHSDTSHQIVRRLMSEPFNIPSMELYYFLLIVIQYRDRRTGLRRTYEISEVSQSSKGKVDINRLYLWHPRNDTFDKANKSLRVFEELNLHTGMKPKELAKDVNEKKKILEWMLKNEVYGVDGVGNIASIYYRDPEYLNKAIKKKWNFNKVIDKW